MSSLNVVLPSWVEPLPKVYWSLASFSFIKLNFIKLSNIFICFPFSLSLLEKTLSRTLYRANFTITVLDFFFWGSYFPILWDLSILSTVIILSFMFSQIVLTATSSVSSHLHSGIPWRSMQLRLEYCSCLPIYFSKIAILSCIFKLLSSNSLNLAQIKSTDSCNLFIRISPLNWLSFVVLTIAAILFIFC